MNQPVLLFDGVCNLCNGFVQFILKHEKHPEIRFAAIQSITGRSLLDQFQIRNHPLHTLYFIDGNAIYEKSNAVFHIISRLKSPWSLLQIFKMLPRRVTDFFYDLVSRKRYAIFGKAEICMVPDVKWESRFLQ